MAARFHNTGFSDIIVHIVQHSSMEHELWLKTTDFWGKKFIRKKQVYEL